MEFRLDVAGMYTRTHREPSINSIPALVWALTSTEVNARVTLQERPTDGTLGLPWERSKKDLHITISEMVFCQGGLYRMGIRHLYFIDGVLMDSNAALIVLEHGLGDFTSAQDYLNCLETLTFNLH